ncbi:MAG TPA: NAD(P)-binding domain-containing protein [Pyrinomonadaceae bacterium]|jgi:thioredoxin reductase (NADPH)
MVIIGAGPAGISMAAEARGVGIPAEKIVVLEKGDAHSWAIRKFYPAAKPVLANYKGIKAVCTGVMCLTDMSKEETLTYIDRVIEQSGLRVHYKEAVTGIRPLDGGGFTVETSGGAYQTARCVIAIGILDKPNKPEYKIAPAVSKRVHYDITTVALKDEDCLVVGGGDTASEYCQFLVQQGNRVTLSYRRREFARLNPVNLESLTALETRGQVRILRESNIVALEDDNGRPRAVFQETEHPAETFDRVVYALGGTTPLNFLKAVGIKFEGEVPVLTQGYETSLPGLYLIGDLSAGRKGGSINLAFNMAAEAMRHISTCPLPSAK